MALDGKILRQNIQKKDFSALKDQIEDEIAQKVVSRIDDKKEKILDDAKNRFEKPKDKEEKPEE